MLTREQFFALKPEVREVEIPALGGSVHVKAMTAGVRDRFEARHAEAEAGDFRAMLAAATICDPDGRLMFTMDDVPALGEIPSAALDDVVKAAVSLNRMGKADVDDLKKTS